MNYTRCKYKMNYTRCKYKIKSWIAMAKAVKQQENSFQQKIGLKFKEKPSEVLLSEQSFVWC